MPLTPRQQRELNDKVLKVAWRRLRALNDVLDDLVSLAQHEAIGTDVRAYLENFATIAEWNAFRTAAATFEDTLRANLQMYLGEGLPSPTSLAPTDEG